jgi:hypothetical protein
VSDEPLPDTARIKLIMKAIQDSGEVPTTDAVAKQFKYETGRELKRVGRGRRRDGR